MSSRMLPSDYPASDGIELSESTGSASASGSVTDSANQTHIHSTMPPSSSTRPAGFFSVSGAGMTMVADRMKSLMMEESSETGVEELEMMDYDNPEDHVNERKLEDENAQFNRLKLTFFRVLITIFVGIVLGLVGFCVSKFVSTLIHANVTVLTSLMNKDRPAAAFFAVLCISLSFVLISSLLVTFGSWQTRGSGVGRLNAYLSGIYSSKFLNLKTLLVKVFGLILTVGSGVKQGMEGPFIHIGAMIGLHVSRLLIWVMRLFGSRCGLNKYTSIISGVVDERMFITGGAAAGFSVAFNAPIAGVLYVQDGAFAYWSGEYTFRTFLCTMTAVTTLNICFISSDVLPTRGLLDAETQPSTNITIQEFWGFLLLGLIGGVLGAAFTKLNVACEHLRSKYLGKRRLPNVLDVLACTFATVLISFVLPFMFSCHPVWDVCINHPERCLRYACGPYAYNDLATFFFELPESTIRILYDRSPEAEVAAGVLVVFCIAYFFMSSLSYGMAVPGGLFIPSIIIGASYGRLVGQLVASVLPQSVNSAGVPTPINPGVYAILGSASMLGGMTRMTLPISVMMIEVTSDAQFLIPIMFVVLVSKVIADRLVGGLYSEHLKMDGLLMVFGDTMPNALNRYTARDLMSSGPLRSLKVIETLEDAQAAILETQHNAFPVIDTANATLKSVEISELIAREKHSAVSATARGAFLGLIQRRHLSYVLSAMPSFHSIESARLSEPMTAKPTEEEIAQYRAGIKDRDMDGLDATPGFRGRHGTISASLNALASDSSDAKPAVLNTEGVNNTASFIDWCATQDPFKAKQTPAAAAPSLPTVADGPENDDTGARSPQRSQGYASQPAAQSGPGSASYVNLSPFIDQGAYIVSENTTARRVWALFRSLGMRHIVVVNHRNQPVGVITRRDVIRKAVAE